MKKKNKIILISGALGQDGIILSNKLIKKKYNVVGLIEKKKNFYINKNIKYFTIDFSNISQLNKLISNLKPDYLVHFGSRNPSFDERKKNKKKLNYENKKNTFNLINSIKKKSPSTIFIFANSSQIFKYSKSKVNEKSKIAKTSYYTTFRVEVLKYMIKLKKNNNFKFVNLILFNHDSIYRNKKFLIPRVIKALKKNNYKFINKIYKKNIYEDFSHAEDICNAIFKVIKKKILVDNLVLSSGKITSVNKIIDYLVKKNKKKSFLIKKSLYNKTFNKFIVGDNSLAKKLLKWKIKKNIFIAADEMYKKL